MLSTELSVDDAVQLAEVKVIEPRRSLTPRQQSVLESALDIIRQYEGRQVTMRHIAESLNSFGRKDQMFNGRTFFYPGHVVHSRILSSRIVCFRIEKAR